MEMVVAVRDSQRLIKIDRRWIRNQLRKAAGRLTPEPAWGRKAPVRRSGGKDQRAATAEAAWEVGVLLVNDLRMRGLNFRYRGLDKTTDVLSFPQAECGPPARSKGSLLTCGDGSLQDPALLGDIVINLHQAGREAVSRGITLRQEVSRLLVHGLLHLLGYDHEKGGSEARRMREMERRLLEGL